MKENSSFWNRVVHDGGIILSLILVAAGIFGCFFVSQYLRELNELAHILLLLLFGMTALQAASVFSRRFAQLLEEQGTSRRAEPKSKRKKGGKTI